uniref:C-C motif chemokine 19 n=1 Tax=Oryzias latipes TaxID=8090 RepID=A0A3P9HFU2_ORYLA
MFESETVLSVLFFFFFSSAVFCFPAAQVPKDCCLSIRQEKLNPKNIVSYSIQEEGDGCQISASVFVNKHGKKLCVAHPKDFPWAQKIMNLVDKRKPASQ